jgi:hypothetical protein
MKNQATEQAQRGNTAYTSVPEPDFSVPEPDFSTLQSSTAYASVPEPDFGALHSAVHASVPEPDFSVPEPDFSILDAATRLRNALASAVERTGSQLRLTLTQALLDALPRPQQLAPAYAMAYRSGEQPGIPLVDLELDEPEDEVTHLQLTAHPKGAPPTYCTIRVQLALQGRDWPDLAEIPVILKLDNSQRLALTDAWGQVSFEDVPTLALAGLQIAVDTGATPPISA